MKKIFVTGGHLTPAIAAIDEIKTKKLPYEIVFIGRMWSTEDGVFKSYEKEIIESLGVRFLAITTGRFQRALSAQSLLSLSKIPVGFVQALYFCAKEKPVAVLSFGGYIALPVVVAAAIFRIPVITHEQTSVPGLANRIIAYFAKKICITFEHTRKLFPGKKVVITGLPVRKELFSTSDVAPFPVNIKSFPIIYITGGSTGSVSLNALVYPVIQRLVKRFTIIHQAGRLSHDEAMRVKNSLPESLRSQYIQSDYFNLSQLAWILRHASLVVGRSGANTVMEVALLGKMALFIPLPWSAGGEQLANARFLELGGTSRVIEQKNVTPETLVLAIEEMIEQKQKYIGPAQKLAKQIPHDGATRLIFELVAILS